MTRASIFHIVLPRLSLRESALLLVTVLLGLLALAGPALLQPAHYHGFADQRNWGRLPHALDVLSNLPFAAWGVAGLWALVQACRRQALDAASAGLAGLFFFGLTITAGLSAFYHWQPDDAGLYWDRAGMVLPFAGLMGLAALQGVGRRAGVALATSVLVLGPAAVQLWAVSGNVLPWAVLQFGGLGLIVWLAAIASAWPPSALPIRWAWVVGLYLLAKLLELADHEVFALTGGWVSGHSLKHAVASCAAWPVLLAIVSATQMSYGGTVIGGKIRSSLRRPQHLRQASTSARKIIQRTSA